jgi:hypothetical protein
MMGGVPANPYAANSLFAALFAKRKIFVSYHHRNDQPYYDVLTKTFAETYEVIQDTSLERMIDSEDHDYVLQRIREKYITGSSCTIVLCGPETPWRKYVDWEIKATLDKEHGLIGVNLPHNPRDAAGRVCVPDRLNDNIISGYATWTGWEQLVQHSAALKATVEMANGRPRSLIVNNRPMRGKNGR